MTKLVYICDFLYGQVFGGAEANDNNLLLFLEKQGYDITRIQSHAFESLINEIVVDDTLFIISNFCNLSPRSKFFLIKKARYIIYEHDHKYLSSRNPAKYKDFTAPRDLIINLDFYESSQRVFCQSAFHLNILRKNLGDSVDLYNVSGNLWSEKDLRKISKLSVTRKEDSYAILESDIEHKNTKGAVEYCEKNNLSYKLIPPVRYDKFLEHLSTNKGLVFLPKTPETLCRVAVEARMMNLEIITNKLLGARYEKWFSLKGEKLVNEMSNRFEEVHSELQKSF